MDEKKEKLAQLEKSEKIYARRSFEKLLPLRGLKQSFEEGRNVSSAGRLITKREHGKSIFCDLSDATDKIQIYVRRDIVGEEEFGKFKSFVDIGDIIGVKGDFFKTHTGEITILVKEFTVLSKSLKPLPEKWHGLKDVESRFRKRYLDLIANRQAAEIFEKRAQIIKNIRKFFDQRGYIEVETPMLQPIPGGAAGRPFITHHNALDIDIYLRIAPELYLKKVLTGGFDKIYELNRSFRNEGISVKHNPEFTMLEAYAAYKDYSYMMGITEDLIRSLAQDLFGSMEVDFGGQRIDFSRKFRIFSLADTLKKDFGVEYSDPSDIFIEKVSAKLNIQKNLSRSQIINLIEDLIEEKYYGKEPVFVIDFYAWMSPLAKTKEDNSYIAERFELFVAGMEVANAYSELNDPREQREKLLKNLKTEEQLPKKIDEDFLEALEYAMPPAAGLGIGIDRLVMLLLGKTSIKEVILFPLLRPENEI